MTEPTAPLVTVDSSDVSHVVACSICHASWVFLSRAFADEAAQAHRLIERERALPRCTVVGCGRYGVIRGMCRPHYDAARYDAQRAGRQLAPVSTPVVREGAEPCAQGDCSSTAVSRGLCRKHYDAARYRDRKSA
ncbi:hypothetical protein [Agromyces sp. S2-1-8]|uniref:hypothetical protein n=1 Tax=Agromyces sp. S2-1-8 TaxID=2897180 RepID=UPI001E54FE93|nr:hypothetical protein [Agromyces sp. S2-1-8]MCD5345061.1 hypothetical protein [Agromyces sp. S2-1-8]